MQVVAVSKTLFDGMQVLVYTCGIAVRYTEHDMFHCFLTSYIALDELGHFKADTLAAFAYNLLHSTVWIPL